MAIQTSNLGYPRIGLQREWKNIGSFWSNKINEEQILTTMKEIRLQHVKVQQEKGLNSFQLATLHITITFWILLIC